MKPVVHWLNVAGISGLYSYTYQLHFKSLDMGYDSHICFFTYKDGVKFKFKDKDGVASPWSVSEGAVNIIHDQLSPFKLDNVVVELHGMPQYVCRDMEHLSALGTQLRIADMFLTRFPSHLQYWKLLTDKAIHVIPPGVDLDFWKPEGKAKEFAWHPTVLWADSWRDGVKEPWDLLYAIKMANKENPAVSLKMVNIPPEKREILTYWIGRMQLDGIIDWPIEGPIANIDEYYRGADMIYCPVNEDGDNVVWEAQACGCPVIHKQDDAENLAVPIGWWSPSPRKQIIHDIKDTAKIMFNIFEKAYG